MRLTWSVDLILSLYASGLYSLESYCAGKGAAGAEASCSWMPTVRKACVLSSALPSCHLAG